MTDGLTRRVVLDTNIIVSALLQPLGPPAQIFLLAMSGSLQLCMSGSMYIRRLRRLSRVVRNLSNLWIHPSPSKI